MHKAACWKIAALLVLLMAAGCGGSSGSGAAPELRTGRFKTGDKALLHNDDGEFVYLGEGRWGIPVGTEVEVLDDSQDEKDLFRKVRIKVPSSAIANGKGKPPGDSIETQVDRRELRPSPK